MRKTLILALASLTLLAVLGGCEEEAPAVQEIEPGLAFVDSVVGTGEEVQLNSFVAVHYTGWLYDAEADTLGNKFDSSVDRGEPIAFPLGRSMVIQGWEKGLPGMKVLHFAFSSDPEHEYLPHNYRPDCVVYLGTHDNDTTLGWYAGLSEQERGFVQHYLWLDEGDDLVRALIRAAYVSVADVAVVTAQDLLRLGTEARMNTPGTSGGNWQWRYPAGALDERLARELAKMTEIYGRAGAR